MARTKMAIAAAVVALVGTLGMTGVGTASAGGSHVTNMRDGGNWCC